MNDKINKLDKNYNKNLENYNQYFLLKYQKMTK